MTDIISVSSDGVTLHESGEEYGDWVNPRDALYDTPDFGYSGVNGELLARPSRRFDRADGRFLPLYWNEIDLSIMRGISRAIVGVSPHAVGIRDALNNFVIGKGFEFSIQPEKGAEPPQGLVETVQKIVDNFLERNSFLNDMDRELFGREVEDGESLAILDDGKDGIARCWIAEPDMLTETTNQRGLTEYALDTLQIQIDDLPSWSYGVFTELNKPDVPLGYHIVFGEGQNDWEFYPESRVEHFKRNVSRNAKRGVSDYYQVWPDLHKEAKLRSNTIQGASVQASIAFIRQHVKGTTQAQAANSVVNTRTGYKTVQVMGGTRQVSAVKYGPGRILDIPDGMEYKPGPMGAERNEGFLMVGQYAMRAAAVRWQAPEYLFTGDASNANYASTLVSESPFVKACESEQERKAEKFSRLIWKAVKMASEAGLMDRFGLPWGVIKSLLKLKVDVPAVATRDPLQMAQTQSLRIKDGTLSQRTAISQNGDDPDEELRAIAEEKASQPQPVAGLLPAPVEADRTGALQGALQGALESVHTTEETKSIIREAVRDYP